MRSCRHRLTWLLVVAMVLFLVVAAGAGIAYLILRQQRAAQEVWTDPLSAVVSREIAPDLALYPLAGASELDTVDAAMDNGELETAYAVLVFGVTITDQQRLGRLGALGAQFVLAGKRERAALCYQQMYDLALLSPRLNDALRAEAIRMAGDGWGTLGKDEHATLALSQVRSLAERSPYLYRAQRLELLHALAETYSRLGMTDQARMVQTRLGALEQEPSPRSASRRAGMPEPPMGRGVIVSTEIGALEEARRQAAYALIAPLAVGQQPLPEQVAALAEALLAEGAAKEATYRQELDKTTQPGMRIDIDWQMIQWLLVKLRVAQGGLGLSVVPQWESQVVEIRTAVSKAFEDLYYSYEDWVTALPDVSLLAPARYETRRLLVLEGRLGRYPNYPAGQLGEKMQAAARDLIASGRVDDLYVDLAKEKSALDLVLSPGLQYGQAVGAP